MVHASYASITQTKIRRPAAWTSTGTATAPRPRRRAARARARQLSVGRQSYAARHRCRRTSTLRHGRRWGHLLRWPIAPLNAQLWSVPGETRTLVISQNQATSTTTISWITPLVPGGTAGTTTYDTLMSKDANSRPEGTAPSPMEPTRLRPHRCTVERRDVLLPVGGTECLRDGNGGDHDRRSPADEDVALIDIPGRTRITECGRGGVGTALRAVRGDDASPPLPPSRRTTRGLLS
jgi:hypothetical protein